MSFRGRSDPGSTPNRDSPVRMEVRGVRSSWLAAATNCSCRSIDS